MLFIYLFIYLFIFQKKKEKKYSICKAKIHAEKTVFDNWQRAIILQ